jgi:hypothetical protein
VSAFAALGVSPLVGRLYTDPEPGTTPGVGEALLSYAFWQQQLAPIGRSSVVITRTIALRCSRRHAGGVRLRRRRPRPAACHVLGAIGPSDARTLARRRSAQDRRRVGGRSELKTIAARARRVSQHEGVERNVAPSIATWSATSSHCSSRWSLALIVLLAACATWPACPGEGQAPRSRARCARRSGCGIRPVRQLVTEVFVFGALAALGLALMTLTLPVPWPRCRRTSR